MKKQCFLSAVTVIILAALLISCGKNQQPESSPAPEATPVIAQPSPTIPEKSEYIRITPQEAESMISEGGVLILDVRTQEEFDDGHIENAVLLPDFEINERAESVIPGKDQTILVYCRTGVRSERASKALIDMGYKSVYDIGGIEDWTGPIVWGASNSIYYNYFGGDLPEDIVTPIDFTVSKSIGDNMGDFEFRVEGVNTKECELNYAKSHYYFTQNRTKISKLTISSSDGSFKQEFEDLQTENWSTDKDLYGLSFDDWNFDGFLDVSLWQYPGGTLRNSPHYYWLWDGTTKQFVRNAELEEISDYMSIDVNKDSMQIAGYSRGSYVEYCICYFEYRNSKFVMVKSEETLLQDNDNLILCTTIKELINGEMVITSEHCEDTTKTN